MTLILSAGFVIGGAVFIWAALFLVAREIHALREFGLSVSTVSITENFFNKAETKAERVVTGAHGIGSLLLLRILTLITPRLRSLTDGLMVSLNRMIQRLGGRHDLSERDGSNTSEYLKDVRSHANESRKSGGAIHE